MKLIRKDLEGVPLLTDSDLDIIFGVLKNSPIKKVEAGSAFIKRGDTSESMYIILKGKFTVHVENLKDESIMTLAKGDSVGEIAILDGKPRSAFVVAQTECEVLEIEKDIFWTLVNSSHEIAVNLLLILSARLRGNNDTISESLELQKKYRASAVVDSLTSLNNRKWLNETLPRLIKRISTDRGNLCVAMIDIDHFKNFNDTFGHPAGDFVLSSVAKAYKENIRPTDFAARYGGEEFTLIFPGLSLEEALTAADRVRKTIMALKLTTPDGKKLPQITISLGLAELKEGEKMEALIARADKALYEAKEGGRNRVCS